jgi:type VII secretion protein EccB
VQSRRDQVQAHSFVAGRLVSAMLRAEPDAPATPLRRFTVGVFIGGLVGVILIAGFGIFGFIKPGGKKSFRNPGSLIVEKETGTRYILVDGVLRPVLNFASAKLILGNDLRVVNTSRNSLKGVPHGVPVGIDSAPDFLPDVKQLSGPGSRDWQVCSPLQPNVSGQNEPFVTLNIGRGPGERALDDGEALLVRTGDGTLYLAWKDRRLRIPNDAVLGALGYGSARQHEVGPAWVNALPAGPDLEAPNVPGRGEPGPSIGGQPTRIGQLFEVQAPEAQQQYFLLTREGLVPFTPTGAALFLGDVRSQKAYPDGRVVAVPLDPAALATSPRIERPILNPGLPVSPPQVTSAVDDEIPCLQIAVGSEDGPDVRIALGQPPAPVAGSGAGAGGGGRLADQVTVQPGGGLLIRDLPAPGVNDGARYLLTDNGIRYPLPDDGAITTLGYAGVPPVAVPTTLLGLIPAGRPLDPNAAKSTSAVAPQERNANDPL